MKNHKFKYDKEISDLGYDRYLDYFIDNKIHLQNDFVARSILTKGRHKDLDFFMNNSETTFIAVPIIHWQREKDLIKLSKSTNKDISQLANKELNEIKLK